MTKTELARLFKSMDDNYELVYETGCEVHNHVLFIKVIIARFFGYSRNDVDSLIVAQNIANLSESDE